MIVYPNAKINIGLNVIHIRKDGYHEISSVFYPLFSCFDVLEIVESDKFSFSSSGFFIPGESNICIDAFKLLKKELDIPNVKIHLYKRIPIGSGLGGGSSDAAFTLKALNKLFKLNILDVELTDYALSLGADCPFFIENTPKYVEGIGEKMLDIDLDLSNYRIEIFDPNIHISTKEAYSLVTAQKSKHNLLNLINSPIQSWRKNVKNDFEKSIFKIYPKLCEYKQDFYDKGAVYSAMSGSGSVIFGIFKKKA